MKIRIKGNSIRFRLTQTEVNALANDQEVAEHTVFSPLESFTIILKTWNLNVADAHLEKGNQYYSLPEVDAKKWALNEEEGIYYLIENGQEGGLQLSIEKDFTCLKPRNDETDQFPNPLAGSAKC